MPPLRLGIKVVRTVLALLQELRGLASDLKPESLQKRLLEGTCRLVGATSGSSLVIQIGADGKRHRGILSASFPAAQTHLLQGDPELLECCLDVGRRRLRCRRNLLGASSDSPGTDCASAGNLCHCLLSPPLPTGGILVAGLLLRRDIDQKRPFSSRDRLLFEMVHSEAGRINSSDPSFGGSDVLHLTPRQYQTLKGLLDGHGEKQIATRMRLSSNTIHSHIKALHRYYRVSSRSELLAHFVQRAHGISNALPTMK